MEKSVVKKFIAAVGLAGLLQCSAAVVPDVGSCPGVKTAVHNAPNGSIYCLSCHDGTAAPDVPVIQSSLLGYDQAGNHPVLISYVQAYMRSPLEFVPPQLLDSRVKLVNGEVQCVSCHEISPVGQWSLVRTEGRGELCLSCHRK